MAPRALGLLLIIALTLSAGCGGKQAGEGKVKVDSTDAFKKLKSTKSPPPKVPLP